MSDRSSTAAPNRDIYFLTAVIAAGFTTVSGMLAVTLGGSGLLIAASLLPVASFVFASRDYYGDAFPSLDGIQSPGDSE